MSKKGGKNQRTPNVPTDFDMRKMWIFVCCFPHKGETFLEEKKKSVFGFHMSENSECWNP